MATPPPPASLPLAAPVTTKALQICLVVAVATFSWLRFSYNAADCDLWGHVLYGHRAWLRGWLEPTDTLSWTAAGNPWINHEALAELVMGLAHRVGGATGLWLLMAACTLTTLFLAGREGSRRGGRWTTFLLFAASINILAPGYAVRPQLFTMLALVGTAMILRRIDEGRVGWLAAVPLLFALWVNFHGGYLAGLVLLAIAAVAMAAQAWLPAWPARRFFEPRPSRKTLTVFLILPLAGLLAALCNPWGWQLISWTIDTVILPRPYITEWQPVGFAAVARLPAFAIVFYLVVAASLFSWLYSTRPVRLWEAALVAALAVMATQHQRHVPLFALVNLMFTPAHLRSAAERLVPYCKDLIRVAGRPLLKTAAGAALLFSAGLSLVQSVAPPRESLFSIEAARDEFPIHAAAFMREYRLGGNTLTYFDWGQYVLWELPYNPVSFDGRLDTVYPVAVMDAHWQFYLGNDPGPALDVTRADVALVPSSAGAVDYLLRRQWREVYRDPLASVLVRSAAAFPLLAKATLPAERGPEAVKGRVPFPSSLPLLGTSLAPR